MKNFKRVISAVIALAISVSSFAAVSAAKFTDVADTASYAEAVEVLSALGIVNGYEDGSFKPDGEITRAEAATMIVGALNMTEDAKASAGTSKFADVNTDASWAAGYVNVGVAQGFIAGMNDTTFAPKDNVTYAQMCVMLTKITGYGDYAAANSTASDWSAGYTAMAASVGINKGVQVSKDTKLTRSQVAQMLYNALLTPQLGVTEYTFSGNTYSQLDGKQNRDFKTLLSDKFDGYQITGMITNTAKTDSGYDNNEIRMTVERADWWPDSKAAINADYANQKFLITGDVDADANLFQSGKAIFVTNEYDEKELVYFAASGKTDIKTFDAADYVKSADLGSNAFHATNKVRFDTKYYTMQDLTATKGVDIYVNGAEYKTITSADVANSGTTSAPAYVADTLLDKLLGGAQGTVTLIKSADDTGYSKIFVNYYEVAEVASVSYKASATTIDFSVLNGMPGTTANKITINDDSVEDGDVDVAVYMGDKEIGLNDIQEDDIIAIKADLNNLTSRSVTDPKFVEILVSRDTASGKLTSINDDDEEVTIDSKTYAAVDFTGLTSNATKFTVGEIYKVTIDPFGRIYDYEATESTKNYAIVEKLNSSSDTVTLILGDGSYKAFDLAGTGSATKTKVSEILDGTAYHAIDSTVAVISGGKVAPQYRVVEYTVKSSTGAVSSMTVTAAVNAAAAADLEYNARTGKLGSYAVEDSTKIINTADYVSKKNATTGSYSNGAVGDYKKMAVSSLADGEKYDAYVFNKVGSFYSFVLVEKAGEKVNATSRFAVVRGKASKGISANDDQCLTMDVLADGEEKVMELAETVKVNGVAKNYTNIAAALKEGSAFFYETDSDGLVSDIYTIYNYQTTNTYAAMTGAYVGDTNITGKYDASKWVFGLQNPTKLDMQLAFGVITNKDNNSVDLAVVTGTTGNEVINKNIADDQNTLQGIYNFRFANDCATYTYDLGNTTSTKLKDKLYAEASSAAVKASTFRLFEDANDSELIHWGTVNGNDINDYANYALVQLVDDEVVAIYEIIR